MTGIVSSDDSKKPTLEQVFVSLSVAAQRSGESLGDKASESSIWGVVRSWADLRELLQLHQKITGYPVPLSSLKKARRALLREKKRKQGLATGSEDKQPKLEQEAMQSWLLHQRGSLSLHDTIADFQLRRVLRDQHRLAILGSPGAGKTTLLQYIALTFARQRAADPKLRERGVLKNRLGLRTWKLPVVIPLSSIASLLVDEDGKPNNRSILDVLPSALPPDLQREKVASEYFASHFTKGNCVVLLDGLDEVPTEEEFQAVVKAIESLAIMFSNNQFVVTSRIAGWRSGIAAEFQVFYVQDLTERQTDTFIDTWYRAVERNAVVGSLKDEGVAQVDARERRSEQRAADLKDTLKENVGIRRLAVNPMLLSIIALVHRSLATLPRERGKLYAQCSKILLEQWDISRGVHVDDTNLKLDQKEMIMRRLAYAYHTGEIGEKGGGREASFAAVRDIVAGLLPSVGKESFEADRLLKRLIERSGVLTERRREILAFSHLTFQEYFTAQHLAAGETVEHRAFLLDPDRLFSDWWREVILLYAGLLSDTGSFIRLIHQPTADDLCQQRLRLSGMCVAEAATITDTQLRQAIVSALRTVKTRGIKRGNAAGSAEETEYLVAWCRMDEWFASAAAASVRGRSNTIVQPSLIRDIVSAIEDRRDVITVAAAQCVSLLPVKAIPPLIVEKLLAIRSSKNAEVRIAAVSALAKLASDSTNILAQQAIIDALDDSDENVQRAAAHSLHELSDKLNSAVTIGPLERLADSKKTRRALAAELFPLFQNDFAKHASDALLRLLNDKDFPVRQAAARSLSNLTNKEAAKLAVSELTARLDHGETVKNLSQTTALLGSSLGDFVDAKTATTLAQLLTRDDVAREAASATLVNLGKRSPVVVLEALLPLLNKNRSSQTDITLTVISHLRGVPCTHRLAGILLALINDGASKTQIAAIYALSALSNCESGGAVMKRLLALTRSHSAKARIAAIYSLANLADSNSLETITAALSFALSDRFPVVRYVAAAALSELELGPMEPKTLRTIFDTFEACVSSSRSRLELLRSFIFDRETKRFEHRGRIMMHLTIVKLGSKSQSEDLFDKLMTVYSRRGEILESGFLSSHRPLELLRPQPDGWDFEGTWRWDHRFWIEDYEARYLYDPIRMEDYEARYLYDPFRIEDYEARYLYRRNPAGITRFVYASQGRLQYEIPNSDHNIFYKQLVEWLPKDKILEKVANLVNMKQAHMRMLGLSLLAAAAGDLNNLGAVEQQIIGLLDSKQTGLHLAALLALNRCTSRAFSPPLIRSVVTQLGDDDVQIREAAWNLLESKGFV